MCFVNGNVDYDDDEEEDDFDYDYEEDYMRMRETSARHSWRGTRYCGRAKGWPWTVIHPACQSCWGKDNDFKN